MKIQSIRCFEERMPLLRPYTIAFQTVTDAHMLFVELHDGVGAVGRGCAAPEPQVTGETVDACRQALRPGALDWLVGTDLREYNRLLRLLCESTRDTPAACAAVDMALHDLLAQHLRRPLVDLLGRVHRELPTSITLGIKDVDDSLEEAREYLQRGFRILKVKVRGDLDRDVERLHRLRERLGRHVLMRVDPNQGYDATSLQRFIERTVGLDLEFIEQPLPAADLDSLRALPEPLRQRIAADESLCTEGDALRLLRPVTACGIFNIKLMKCGGIRPALRIAALAETAGVALMWGCMDESRISIAAALHAAFASPLTRYLDLDGSLDLARDVVSGGFEMQAGMMRTLPQPGLGLIPVP